MPILTRLALGASAVSALSALGTGLPAAAQQPAQAPARPAPTTAAAATPVLARATSEAPAHRASSAPKASRAKATRAKAPAHRRRAAHPAATSSPHAATHTTTAHASATHATAHRDVTRNARSTAKAHAKRSTATAIRTPARTTTPPRRVTGGRTSENWSGYTQSATDLRRAVTSVSASWQVPRAEQRSSGDTEAASDWVGIGGSRGTAGRGQSDPSLIQAGTTTTVGRAGTPSDYAWYETLPTAAVETPLATRSGDRLSVEIGRVGADRWRIRMANATTGRTWSTSVRYAANGSSADFVTERPDTSAGPTTLPTRSATSFRQAKVNGASTRFRPSQRVTMTDGTRAVATASGPEGAKGDGFSVCSYATHCGAGSR